MCPSTQCSTISLLFFSLSVIDLVIPEKSYTISVFFNYCADLPEEGRQRQRRRPRKRTWGPGTFRGPLLPDNPTCGLWWGCTQVNSPLWSVLPRIHLQMSQHCNFCCVHSTFFFFLSHKILESFYAWNRYESLVGVRLSFSSGVAPPYPHGLWYSHLLTVILKANTLNFTSKE